MEFISHWVQGIIVAVAIGTIIEMIIPNGNSKKYIKIVIGIFVIFNIISPIINKFTDNRFDLETIADISKYEEKISSYEISSNNLQNNNNNNIKEVYILNLKKDIKAKVEDKGYSVINIYIDIADDSQYTIKNISLNVGKKEENKEESSNDVNKIEEVNIEVKISNVTKENKNITNTLTSSEIDEIKEYIKDNYNIDKKNISIN